MFRCAATIGGELKLVRAPQQGKKSHGKRYTDEEREEYLKAYREHYESDAPLDQPHLTLPVSRSTLYRWQAKERRDKESAADTQTIAAKRVERAIAILAAPPRIKVDDLRAIFELIFWLRWPTNAEDYSPFIASCFVSYLVKGRGYSRLSDLPRDEIDIIAAQIDVDAIVKFFSIDMFDVPSFEYGKYEGSGYTDRDFLSNLGHYFIFHAANGNPKSIKSAVTHIRRGLFDSRFYLTSESTFRARWRSHAATIPFLYVEAFHPLMRWDLDPSEPNFREYIDELLESREQIPDYLSRCKWAVRQFVSGLDPRALNRLSFPSFPEWLPEHSLEITTPQYPLA